MYSMWAGLILGVSFIATPVKFRASSLTVPIALDVGRVTFQLFNKIEWGVLAVTTLLTLVLSLSRRIWFFIIALMFILALQTFYLLPTLDLRVDAIMANDPLAPGYLHGVYVIIEGIKLGSVMCCAWMAARMAKV